MSNVLTIARIQQLEVLHDYPNTSGHQRQSGNTSAVRGTIQPLTDCMEFGLIERQKIMTDFGDRAIKLPMMGSTMVEVLRYRALHQPEQLAFTFLQEVETEATSLTYGELDRRSRAIAAQLQAVGMSSERALLLYPPGLEYLTGFFGCLYAGVVAVPAYPPRNLRNTPRIKAIAADAQAAIILTTTAILPKVQSLLGQDIHLDSIQWLTTDNLASRGEESWQTPFINGDSLAFLQYTSGSTGTPKGVMLSHRNLLHNAATTYQWMEHSPSSRFVSWLPAYHDMGLIGGILQPLYGGFPCFLMAPATFLQSPYRWLKAISHHRGTTSGGPNFAYELCVEKITPEQRKTLDLSSWRVAFNGAEPIRAETLERFADTFAECGFRPEAFYPCYGMAEATLMVSGVVPSEVPTVKRVRVDALERDRIIEETDHLPQGETPPPNSLPVYGEKAEVEQQTIKDEVRAFVSCGRTIPEQQIVIANPETLTRCQPQEVGEIWVSGPSIGKGYWNRVEETKQTFRAYLSDTGEGPFLRTGDLGFLQNGELFITGRAKDLIIIRGRNLYPQDIEFIAERSHSTLRLGSGAAFAVEMGNEERLVVVQELEFRAKPNLEEVTAAIRQAVTEAFEVQVYAVVLIKGGTIPKTSSGKIQRRACKAEFLAGTLDIVGSSILQAFNSGETEYCLTRQELLAAEPQVRQGLLEFYLQEQVARALQVAASQLKIQHPLSSFGLDSLKVFELKNRIETNFLVEISLTDLFEGASIAHLAAQILDQLANGEKVSVPISKVETDRMEHPLSFAQQRLWFLDQLEPGNPAYNIAIALTLEGALNVPVLEQSLQEMVRRHEALRTSFKTINGQPVQVIAPSLTLPLGVIDCQSFSQAQQRAVQEIQQPFDLKQGPLFRAKLLRLSEQNSMLLLTMHHIISDGWSVEVLVQEMGELYKAFLTGSASFLPELSIQYKDFSHWQRQWLQGAVLDQQLSYWKQQLADAPAVLQLPTDRPRPAVQTSRGAHQSIELSAILVEELKAIARQEGVTLFMVLLAAFQTFLYRYTGQDDISVGSPIANRNREEFKGVIGFFVNTLVLRTDLSGNPSFCQLLSRVRKAALGAYTHQDLPFEQLVEALQPERNISHTPLFQSMFVLQTPPQLPEMPGLALSLFKVESETSQFDLSLTIDVTDQGAIATFEYNTDLFEHGTITRMRSHLQNLLAGIIANPHAQLSDLPLLTAAEQEQLLVEFNQHPFKIQNLDPQRQQCIHHLFEAQAEKTPDAIAVVWQNQHLTYRELNEKANQLAHRLQTLGVQPEVLVGLYLERSLEMVVAVLGVLKAGGAYIPLDPVYSQERLAFMVNNINMPVLVAQAWLIKQLPKHGAQVVCLDATGEESKENLVTQVTPDNLAYVIYTSGSTGTPKGVMVTHRSLVQAYLAWEDAYHLRSTATSHLQMASFSFDVFAGDWVRALCSGAKLVLCPREALLQPDALYQLMRQEQVDCAEFVPSVLMNLLPYLEQTQRSLDFMRLLIAGSDSWSFQDYQHVKRFCPPQTRLINSYGVSEATIDSTYFESSASDLPVERLVPIGRPFPNTQIYLLDVHLQPVPIGVTGEVYIGGTGLARGYFNRPDLTAEKFIPHPFSNKSGARLYKTGDLARYLPNGDIEFLGRSDYQVKIRGFRIELGEIEAILSQHPAVEKAVVLVREDEPGDKRLVAYVVQNPQSDAIENWLPVQELGTQQLSQWQRVFDDLYRENDPAYPLKFHIEGWNSSYTGQPIPDAEVREWMEQTVDRILSLQPTKVLELGCGTGLMLLRIAPHCQEYCAVDQSKNALNILQAQLEMLEQPLPGVRLIHSSAGDFVGVEANTFDAVCIVSVAQYFPSINYLVQVLEKAVSAVEPGGFIFLGDVRSLPLLEVFHTSVQFYRAPDSLSLAELKQRVQKQLFEEKQLVIDPAFFTALKQHLPKISQVEILLERGYSHNELSKFRYDVILHIGEATNSTIDVPWLDWEKAGLTLASVRRSLIETQPEILGIARVPNARTAADWQILSALANPDATQTVGDLRQALATLPPQGIEPEDFWALGKDLPYSIHMTWSGSGAEGRYDVVFQHSPNPGQQGLDCILHPVKTSLPVHREEAGGVAHFLPLSRRPWSHYANNPLQASFALELVPKLRAFLKEKLPEYMVPAAFVVLDSLPLTSNGKLNRRALPSPEGNSAHNTVYIAPESEIEQIIATIWQQVLRVDRVGIHDNFFDLGGHSLLIGQVHVQLKEKLQREISVVDIFQYPTISTLAKYISQKREKINTFSLINDRAEKQKAAFGKHKRFRKEGR